MKVKNHLLFDDNGVQVTFKKTPNHGGLKKSNRFIVIHYTASSNAEGAISWMLSPQSKVSAELHIARDGKIVQLLPFNETAWHAGKSEWKGVVGLNSHSVGIELQNTGIQEYTTEQLNVLVEVCKALVEEYGEEEIVGHSDISPGRKQDPGKQFPMEWLREQVYGNVKEPKTDVYKTISGLNLRSGAGTNFSVLEVLKKGSTVKLLDMHGDWSHVYVPDSDKVGYVSSKYLTNG